MSHQLLFKLSSLPSLVSGLITFLYLFSFLDFHIYSLLHLIIAHHLALLPFIMHAPSHLAFTPPSLISPIVATFSIVAQSWPLMSQSERQTYGSLFSQIYHPTLRGDHTQSFSKALMEQYRDIILEFICREI